MVLNELINKCHLFSLDAPEEVFHNSREYPENNFQTFEEG